MKKMSVLIVALGLISGTACGSGTPQDLTLSKDVTLDKLGLSAKLPKSWTLEEEKDYNDTAFRSYLVKGKSDVMRLELAEGECITAQSIDAFASHMTEKHKDIDSKAIPKGKGRTPDKLTATKVIKSENGPNGVLYKNEFTTEVDGKELFVSYEGKYLFYISNKSGQCIKIESTEYNKGKTLPTDLKVIESIH